ncbi:Rap1a/Tai family immunity protein [Mesorhizobium amorphae]|uniref:Rap1a/Tai family immunity protein n=1 Tax=Mesorhizobium amorphae TaxID=71433 RepID=UPI00235D2CD6|nr:hypothetical protein GCM10007880_19810 [Mesorhizobium amorphae]
MNRIAAIALIAAGLFPSHASAEEQGFTTQGLLDQCNTKPGSVAAALCLGYIAGVADTMIQPVGEDAQRYKTCPGTPTPTYGAYRQVFVNWAQKHPEKWNSPMFAGVSQSLHEMWPCQ